MGFLDNSTNNIILDAVLTDAGRQALARNDGSFSIHGFKLGDDEVNYGIIKKYGITVGKEKIEKNTPVFEAQTNQNYALKYKLFYVDDQTLTYLPQITLRTNSTTISLSTSANTINNVATISVEQKMLSSNPFPQSMLENTFTIDMSDLFLTIQGSQYQSIDSYRRAYYTLARESNNGNANSSVCTFTITTKTIGSQLFNVYASDTNKSVIKTYINVVGSNFGSTLTIPVEINK